MTLENKIKNLVENNCYSKAYAEVCKAFNLGFLEVVFNIYAEKEYLTAEEASKRHKFYEKMLEEIKNTYGESIAKAVYSWL